jgi:hypothetical protein
MSDMVRDYWPLFLLLGGVGFAALVSWTGKRPVRGLYLAFFTSGILLSPHLPLVRDKLTATEVAFLLTWFALLLQRGRSASGVPLGREQRLSLLLGVAFFLWLLLSFALNNMVYTEAFVPSLVETANLAYGYLMFLTTVMLARDWQAWQGCVNWWVAGSTVVVIFGVWAMVGGAPVWTYEEFTHRVSSTLRNENQVPSYLLPIFVVMVFMAVRKGARAKYQMAMWALVAGALLTAIGTGSRTALLMLLLAFAGVAYVALRTAGNRSYRVASLLNVSLALVAGLVVYVSVALFDYQGDYALGRTPPWQRPVVMFYDWMQGYRQLDSTRPEQLMSVMDHVGDHLLIGTGPKVYGGLFQMAEIHNTYAGVLMQTGLIGLLLFLLWLGHLLWHTFVRVRRITDPWKKVLVLSLLVGMATLLLYNMTMFGLRQRTIWLLAGLLVASWSLAGARGRQPEVATGHVAGEAAKSSNRRIA